MIRYFLLLFILCFNIAFLSGQSDADAYLSDADELLNKAKISEALKQYAKADSLFSIEENWEQKYKAVYGSMYCQLRLGNGQKMSKGLDNAIPEAAKRLGPSHLILANLYYLKIIHSDRFLASKSNLIHIQKVDEILAQNDSVDEEFKAKFYNIKGITWYKLKDYEKALEYYNQTLTIKKRLFGEESAKISTTYNNIGICYFVQNELEKAIYYYEKALQIKLKVLGPDHPRVADSQFNIGLIYGELQEHDKAEQKVLEALRIAKINEEEQAFKLAHRTSELAKIYRETDREYASLKIGAEAIELYKKANQSPEYSATGYQVQGLTYSYFGHFKKAVATFQLAFKELTGYADTTDYSYNPPLDPYNASGRMHLLLQFKAEALFDWYMQNNDLKTLQDCFKTCEDLITCTRIIRDNIQEEKSLYSFIADSRENFEFALDIADELFAKTQDPLIIERALAIYEESRAALLQRQLAVNIARQRANISSTIIEEKNKLNQKINRLILKMNEEDDTSILANHQAELIELKESYSKIVQKINTQLPSTGTSFLANNSDQLSTIVKDNAGQVVGWFYGQKALYRFTNLQGSITFDKIIKQDSLDQRIEQLRSLITDDELAVAQFGSKTVLDKFYSLSRSIYSDIIPRDLKKGKEIILITDGLLSTIPLEILVDPSTRNQGEGYAQLDYLLHKAPIRYVASPSLLAPSGFSQESEGILAFAPTYEGDNIPIFAMRSGFSKLDFAKEEVHAIANKFPTKLMVGSQANKANLLTNIEDFSILHFAMHAYTDEERPA